VLDIGSLSVALRHRLFESHSLPNPSNRLFESHSLPNPSTGTHTVQVPRDTATKDDPRQGSEGPRPSPWRCPPYPVRRVHSTPPPGSAPVSLANEPTCGLSPSRGFPVAPPNPAAPPARARLLSLFPYIGT